MKGLLRLVAPMGSHNLFRLATTQCLIPGSDTRDEQQVEELAGLIKQKAAKLVIIDNLGYISGGADENSVEMVEVMAHLRWLAEETGAAIVVIHHSRKSRSDNSRKGTRYVVTPA